MALILKQSTAVVISFGPFVDKTDGVTPETGLVSALDHASTGIMLSKNGGALTIRHATVTATTYDAYGNYRVTLDTTDTNTVGTLRVQFIETATCLPVWADFQVVEEEVYDDQYAASAVGYLKPVTAGRDVVVDAAGLADANAVKLGPTGAGTAQTARDVGASVLISSGTGTGQLDVASGVVKANLAQILGTALTETAGLLAGGFKKFFNVSSPTGTLNSIPDAVPDAVGGLPVTGNRLTAIPTIANVTNVANLTNAPTAGDLTATMKASVAAAVLDDPSASHVGAGSVGERIERLDIIASGGAGGLTDARAVKLDQLDAAVSTRATPAQVNTEVDNALDTAIPVSPTADSVNERLKTIDDANLPGRTPAALVGGRMDSHMGSVADGVITAAKFAANALDAVWSTTVRILTAGTNIVLAKGVGVTGFNDLSAAQVNSEVDSALDTAIPGTPTANSVNERLKTMDDADIPAAVAAVAADHPVKFTKNVAFNNFEFLMVDSTDHVTPKTGLTVTAQRSIDGAAFAACANAVTEVGSGAYKLNLAAGDLNGDGVMLKFTATGADARYVYIVTQPT